MARSSDESTSQIQGSHAICVGEPQRDAPRGWQWVKLTDIATLETGHTPSRSVAEYWNGDIPWVSIPDARVHHAGEISRTRQMVTQAGIDNSAARVLPAGTVCLSRTASVGYVTTLAVPSATSQDFVCWICSGAIDPEYLKWILLAEGDDIRRFGKGTTHTTIYFPEVRAFRVCIPPLAEQRRIVAKLEELLGRIRRARAALDAVPAMVERYKKSVLGAACRGEANVSSVLDDEHASLVSRSSLRYRPFSAPQHWKRHTLGLLAERITSGSRAWSAFYRSDGECTFVMAQNVRPLSFVREAVQRVSPPADDADRRRTKVVRDDLLVTIVGAGTGDACRVDVEVNDYFVCQSVALIRLREPTYARFVEFWLNSFSHGGGQLHEWMYGDGRPHLSLEQLRSLVVALPPLDEQRAIVARIDAAFARARALLTAAETARTQLDALERSVLAKAFRGELVPQDPSDEPASALLERVRAGAAESAAPKRAKKAKRASA